MIHSGLFQYLAADATVSAIVLKRIYGVMLPKNYALPAIVYSSVGSTPVESLGGDNPLRIQRWQFDCYAEDYFTTQSLKEAVRSLLAPKSDGSGATATVNYELPDGTQILAAQVHLDHDEAFQPGAGGFIFRALLDIQFSFVPSS